MTNIDNAVEKNIYNVFLENKSFLEKFVGGGLVEIGVNDAEAEIGDEEDTITLSGHAFSLIENQPNPEAANCIRKFNDIGDEILLYVADAPVWAEKEVANACVDSMGITRIASPSIRVDYQSVLLTSRGIHTHYSKEIFVPWKEIYTILDNNQLQSWYVYKKIDGKRVGVAGFDFSTLVGGHNSLNLKKWRKFFAQLINVAHQTATAD